MGQGLHVVDERRTAGHAALERAGWHPCRLRVPAVEPMDQCRLLTGHVVGGRLGEPYLHGLLACSIALVEGVPHGGDGRAVAPLDADDGLLRADRSRRGHDAVEHQMRRQREQDRVLDARRLAFGPVGDDDGRPAIARASGRRPADGLELRAGREARAAPAPQAGPVHHVHEPACVVRMGEHERSEAVEVIVEAGRCGRGDQPREHGGRHPRRTAPGAMLITHGVSAHGSSSPVAEDDWCNSSAGVPDRRAHPGCSGPAAVQASTAMGTMIEVTSAASRSGRRSA